MGFIRSGDPGTCILPEFWQSLLTTSASTAENGQSIYVDTAIWRSYLFIVVMHLAIQALCLASLQACH